MFRYYLLLDEDACLHLSLPHISFLSSRMIEPTPVSMRRREEHELCGGLDPMGEKENQPFQLSFNPLLRVDFQGSRVTSDSGLLLVRELDERPGLSSLLAEHLTGDRRGKNIQLPLPD